MTNSNAWVEFDENFDSRDGGALYIRDNNDGTYSAAGALWLDGGDMQERHYTAIVCDFDDNQLTYGDVLVTDEYFAGDAFGCAIDSDISHDIGMFSTMGEAVQAVHQFANA
ncbi:hypothetical protein AAK684_04330 [Leptogranulimonas caecicola]|nr:hypothetical protein [Leptogranulimonas caecicola]